MDTVHVKITDDLLAKALKVFGVIRVFGNPDIRSQVREYLEHEQTRKMLEEKIEKSFGPRWHHAVYRCEAYSVFEKALRLVMIQSFYEEIAQNSTFDGQKTVSQLIDKALNSMKNGENSEKCAQNEEKLPETVEFSVGNDEKSEESHVVH